MEISGYTNNPSPPPLEHPNSARSKASADTKDESGTGSPEKDKDSAEKKEPTT